MLDQLQSLLATLCNMGGLIFTIVGGLIVAWSLMNSGDARSLFRGGALIIAGILFAGLAR